MNSLEAVRAQEERHGRHHGRAGNGTGDVCADVSLLSGLPEGERGQVRASKQRRRCRAALDGNSAVLSLETCTYFHAEARRITSRS